MKSNNHMKSYFLCVFILEYSYALAMKDMLHMIFPSSTYTPIPHKLPTMLTMIPIQVKSTIHGSNQSGACRFSSQETRGRPDMGTFAFELPRIWGLSWGTGWEGGPEAAYTNMHLGQICSCFMISVGLVIFCQRSVEIERCFLYSWLCTLYIYALLKL